MSLGNFSNPHPFNHNCCILVRQPQSLMFLSVYFWAASTTAFLSLSCYSIYLSLSYCSSLSFRFFSINSCFSLSLSLSFYLSFSLNSCSSLSLCYFSRFSVSSGYTYFWTFVIMEWSYLICWLLLSSIYAKDLRSSICSYDDCYSFAILTSAALSFWLRPLIYCSKLERSDVFIAVSLF